MELAFDFPSRCARFLFTVLMALAWCGGADQARAQAAPEPPAPVPTGPSAGDRLARSLAGLELLRRDTRRDSFDPRAIVEQVGREPAALFQWVRDNTWWVPYRGALRGPAGVLMDRVGNSLDRSLLLAELLRVAGHPVRLARAALDEAAAAQLIEKVRMYPGRAALPDSTQPVEQVRARLSRCAEGAQLNVAGVLESFDASTLQSQRTAEELVARTAEQTALVMSAVNPRRPDAAVQGAKMLDALRDHWWVQCQQDGKWVDLDVLLPQAEVGKAHSQAKQTLNIKAQDGAVALPDDAIQEVTIRLVIERWQGGKTHKSPVLTAKLSGPEFLGTPITIQQGPGDWPKDVPLNSTADPKAMKQALLAQRRWLPVLMMGKRQIADQGFTTDGQLVARSRFDGPMDVGGKTGGLFGGLGGGLTGDEQPAASHLTAEWIEFEIHVPGQPNRVVSHEIFDLIGPAARQDNKKFDKMEMSDGPQVQRALRMLSPVRVLGLSCRPTDDYVTSYAASASQELHRAISGDQVDYRKLMDAMGRSGLAHGALYQWAQLRFDGSTTSNLVYLDRPNLIAQRVDYVLDDGGQLFCRDGLDVLANEVAVCSAAADRAITVRIEQGVADTLAEEYNVSTADPWESTAGLFSIAKAQGRPPVLVRPGEQVGLNALTPEAQARLRRELGGDYAALVASTTGDNAAMRRSAWWRIDEKTGNTVGMSDTGYHSALTDFIVVVAIIGIAALVIYYFFEKKIDAMFSNANDALKGTEVEKTEEPKKKEVPPGSSPVNWKAQRKNVENFGKQENLWD